MRPRRESLVHLSSEMAWIRLAGSRLSGERGECSVPPLDEPHNAPVSPPSSSSLMASDTDQGPPKRPRSEPKSGRRALSCTECKRRKTKCSALGKTPCDSCIKRGRPADCYWEDALEQYISLLPVLIQTLVRSRIRFGGSARRAPRTPRARARLALAHRAQYAPPQLFNEQCRLGGPQPVRACAEACASAQGRDRSHRLHARGHDRRRRRRLSSQEAEPRPRAVGHGCATPGAD